MGMICGHDHGVSEHNLFGKHLDLPCKPLQAAQQTQALLYRCALGWGSGSSKCKRCDAVLVSSMSWAQKQALLHSAPREAIMETAACDWTDHVSLPNGPMTNRSILSL